LPRPRTHMDMMQLNSKHLLPRISSSKESLTSTLAIFLPGCTSADQRLAVTPGNSTGWAIRSVKPRPPPIFVHLLFRQLADALTGKMAKVESMTNDLTACLNLRKVGGKMMCKGPSRRLSKEQREELERVIRTTREALIITPATLPTNHDILRVTD
jgi:hypothetical protein